MSDIKVTDRVRKILDVLLSDTHELTALSISQQTGLGPGTIYPTLARLERDGWIESAWETPDPLPDRPRRRFYALTRHGRTRILQALGRYE